MYPGTRACHDANVRHYAAYLRVSEPLSAFSDAQIEDIIKYIRSLKPRQG